MRSAVLCATAETTLHHQGGEASWRMRCDSLRPPFLLGTDRSDGHGWPSRAVSPAGPSPACTDGTAPLRHESQNYRMRVNVEFPLVLRGKWTWMELCRGTCFFDNYKLCSLQPTSPESSAHVVHVQGAAATAVIGGRASLSDCQLLVYEAALQHLPPVPRPLPAVNFSAVRSASGYHFI